MHISALNRPGAGPKRRTLVLHTCGAGRTWAKVHHGKCPNHGLMRGAALLGTRNVIWVPDGEGIKRQESRRGEGTTGRF